MTDDDEVLKVLKQIAEDLRWLRNHAEAIEAEREELSDETIKAIERAAKAWPRG